MNASHGAVKLKRIQVYPYDTESYDFAVVFFTGVGCTTERLIGCTYDKATKISSSSDRSVRQFH